MRLHRTSGILLHPSSLPGPFGIGDLGPAAYRFVDFLADAGQGLWQVLPLGPTGYRDSPYQCLSAFAGNPLLIAPESLLARGWIEPEHLGCPEFPAETVDFGEATAWKARLLLTAEIGFRERATATEREDYERFKSDRASWLDDYALFAALKSAHGHRSWTEWPEILALRGPEALVDWASSHAERIEHHRFVQYLFYSQWSALASYAHEHGVRIVGDMPIFVAHDSCEVWTHPEWFDLDATGYPRVVAGVPPDYFSATGQRWGNPLYRWDRLAEDGYALWVERLRLLLGLVDLVRVDHFRGFAAHWEIPGEEKTAEHGCWVPGPGIALFDALCTALGKDLPLIAEDLGVITQDVEALRDALELPGMAVLQFAFEDAEDWFGRSEHLPHRHRANLAVYTGTHDNEPLHAWWAAKDERARGFVRRYLATDGREIHWDFIRAALSSVASLAIYPLQDVLGRGPEGCMNRPGRADGNWRWRFRESDLDPRVAERLNELSRVYGRLPYGASKPTD